MMLRWGHGANRERKVRACEPAGVLRLSARASESEARRCQQLCPPSGHAKPTTTATFDPGYNTSSKKEKKVEKEGGGGGGRRRRDPQSPHKLCRMWRHAGTTDGLVSRVGGSVSGSTSGTSVMYGIRSQLFHGP